MIAKEVEKSRDRGQECAEKGFAPAKWGLPAHIITFLASKVSDIEQDKLRGVKLQQWPTFKKEIFAVLDHRIETAPEINGVINTSYMPLSEHLVIYMVQLFENPTSMPRSSKEKDHHGSKEDIQHKLIEFLYNLKYYSTRWLRARTFAEMVGFMTKKGHLQDKGQAPESVWKPDETLLEAADGVDDQAFDDVEIPQTDIYAQEFFLYAYSFISRDRKGYNESTEGYTYIRQHYEWRQTMKVHNLLYGDLPKDVEGWQKRIKANIQRMKVNELDEAETDFIDLDLVLQFYMEDYYKLRRANQRKIVTAIKACNMHNVNLNQDLSIKDVKRILVNIIPAKSGAPNVVFAKEVTMMRAFIYSLVCETNSSKVSAEAFLAGCNRFGIDNPCPIITKRMALYGNSEDLDKDFKRLLEKYQKEHDNFKMIEADVHGPAELKGSLLSFEQDQRLKKFYDFKETIVRSPLRKQAGILNMSLLVPETFGKNQELNDCECDGERGF